MTADDETFEAETLRDDEAPLGPAWLDREIRREASEHGDRLARAFRSREVRGPDPAPDAQHEPGERREGAFVRLLRRARGGRS